MPEREIYKVVDGVELAADIFHPGDSSTGSAIAFFHGGGWTGGTPAQFHPQCLHLASLGMLALSFEYRLIEHEERPAATPFECVADGRSGLRWLRSRAAELGIDAERIAAGGGSAGGHVAAACGLIGESGAADPDRDNDRDRDLDVSAVPDALVLYNPVIDTTLTGWTPGAEMLGDREEELSPTHWVKPGAPPAILFHGTADEAVPFENTERFTRLMAEAGNDCELVGFEGESHGFFNEGRGDGTGYERTLEATVGFLERLGFLRT